MSVGFVRDLEQGRFRRPSPDLLKRLAGALELDLRQQNALLRASLPDTGRSASECSGPRIDILGSVRVFGRGKVRCGLASAPAAFLGLLAMHANATVSRCTIVDALWGEHPPRSAVGIVYTYASRLRSALGSDQEHDGALIVQDGIGYRLQVTENQLDLLVFRRLVKTARECCAAGNLEEACGAFEKAFELWRGEPLADVQVLHGHPAVVALAEERKARVLEYADAALKVRRWHSRVLPYLQALAARDPLDENCSARLMMMLAAMGRQAEALGAYEELRLRLDEELGVLPGPTIREAHARILRQDVPIPAETGQPAAVDARWAFVL